MLNDISIIERNKSMYSIIIRKMKLFDPIVGIYNFEPM
jgi:hypothetical protein